MRLIRFHCGCSLWKEACYQRGNNHYIAVPETENENIFKLEVSEILQKGKKIWLGGKEANKIDFMSHVPQVEDHLDQTILSQHLSRKEQYPKNSFCCSLEFVEIFSAHFVKSKIAFLLFFAKKANLRHSIKFCS